MNFLRLGFILVGLTAVFCYAEEPIEAPERQVVPTKEEKFAPGQLDERTSLRYYGNGGYVYNRLPSHQLYHNNYYYQRSPYRPYYYPVNYYRPQYYPANWNGPRVPVSINPPAPSQPAPVQPAPVQPAPVQPAPIPNPIPLSENEGLVFQPAEYTTTSPDEVAEQSFGER